jgi:hypothetical protein
MGEPDDKLTGDDVRAINEYIESLPGLIAASFGPDNTQIIGSTIFMNGRGPVLYMDLQTWTYVEGMIKVHFRVYFKGPAVNSHDMDWPVGMPVEEVIKLIHDTVNNPYKYQ